MDSYQPIYDAVRSKISNGDIGQAVENSLRDSNFSHYVQMAMSSIEQIASEYDRPCAIFRPKLSLDGNQWCALYGENLQDGVAGFGESPALAMRAFDTAWTAKYEVKK